MQFIKDLKPNSGVDEITMQIVAKEPARFIREPNFNGLRSVAIGRDVTGEVRLTLQGPGVTDVELGDRIRITNGWCGVVQGDRVLSKGRHGTLVVLKD